MRIAVAQTPGTRLEDWPQTLAMIRDVVAQAAAQRADLVVLPECVWPAYYLGSRQRYREARRAGMPGADDFLRQAQQLARDYRMALCVGYVADQGDKLFNAASLIGPDGQILGTHHKCFLWDFDHDYFEPGCRLEPVGTASGRVGLLVCADARLPEIPATLVARGAELLLQPTAWVNAGTSERPWNPQPDFLIPTRAAELGVAIASASKWGAEGACTFVGGSLICDHGGNVLAQCGQAETCVLTAEVVPTRFQTAPVSPTERAVLTARQPPQLPTPHVQPLAIMPLPTGTSHSALHRAARTGTAAGKTILGLTCADAPSKAPPDGGGDCVLLNGPADRVLELGHARIAAVPVEQAGHFAPFRVLALDGVHLIVVFGRVADLRRLKTRACENRVFVAVAEPDGWQLIDPRGCVADEGSWPLTFADARPIPVDLAQAADKEVVPRTNVLAGRNPALYEL